MEIKTINYDKIDETMYLYQHESGLKAFVIPKKGYSKICSFWDIMALLIMSL